MTSTSCPRRACCREILGGNAGIAAWKGDSGRMKISLSAVFKSTTEKIMPGCIEIC